VKKALGLALTVCTMLALAGCTGGQTEPATRISATSAVLHGLGSCQADDAGEWWFEFRRGTSGAWTPLTHHPYGAADCPVQDKPISETVSGLTPNTQYQFRACATDPAYWQGPSCVDKGGVSNQPDWETFTTTNKLGGFMENWFGRNGAPLPDDADAKLFQAAKSSGAQIARFNVQWCALEPTEGSFPAGPWNTVIDRIENKIMADPNGIPNTGLSGMRPLPILINAPVWARADADKPANPPNSCANVPPQNPDDPVDAAYPPDDAHLPQWNEFIGRFIRCMRGVGPAGQGCPTGVTPPLPQPTAEEPIGGFEARAVPIQGYEIWNEPNLGKYWGKATGTLTTDDADRFARMVKNAFVLTHYRPVVLGGLSFPEDTNNQGNFGDRNVTAERYINRIYNLFSDTPQFDAIGIHPYGAGLHTRADVARDHFNSFRAEVRNDPSAGGHGDDHTQIWVTEVGDEGCQPATADCSLSLQAQHLRNMWEGENELPVPVLIYYRLMDDLNPEHVDTGRRMGVLPENGFSNPKPAYCDLADKWGRTPSICLP
jgi:hypothetical protein